jgi:hypothetical protein
MVYVFYFLPPRSTSCTPLTDAPPSMATLYENKKHIPSLTLKFEFKDGFYEKEL